jgi:hypothetical protein
VAQRRAASTASAACRTIPAIRRAGIDAGRPSTHRDAIGGHRLDSGKTAMFSFLLWCLLFVFCWPLALLALVLYPIVWLLALPFRLVGISVGAVFALLTALLFLPARALGHRR